MRTIKINSKNYSPDDIKEIATALKSGQVVLFPTETVYTFAVDATREECVRKVYEIKGRDFSKPLHVVVDSLINAKNYVEINENAEKLANKFLPGPLTLVLPKKIGVLPDMLTSGLSTLGIRIPNLDICIDVAKEFKKPYTTTSANISGGTNTYSVDDVLKQFDEKKLSIIDLVVDIGPLTNLLPSTLIDLTVNPPQILRVGPITQEQIKKVIGNVVI